MSRLDFSLTLACLALFTSLCPFLTEMLVLSKLLVFACPQRLLTLTVPIMRFYVFMEPKLVTPSQSVSPETAKGARAGLSLEWNEDPEAW